LPSYIVSPWARGNQYWYPDEWVSYAMVIVES